MSLIVLASLCSRAPVGTPASREKTSPVPVFYRTSPRHAMASGFDTRVSANCNPTGVAKGGAGAGRGVVFTVTYAGC